MVNPEDDNGSLDRKPAALAVDCTTTKKRSPPPRYSQAEAGSANNGGSATKPGSVPVTPHQVMLSPKKPRFHSPSNDLSPLSLKGTFSPMLKWPEDHQLALPQLPPSPEVTYIKIPRQHIAFNATTWWLVDLHHEPPMEQGATPLVARCLRRYPSWDEALARRVLKGYQQYLSLTIDVQDWRGRLLLAPPLVDKMWRLHVQDLATYCHDCMLLCGQVLSRNMEDSSNLEQRRADTLRQLRQKFGSGYDAQIWSYGEGVAKAVGNPKPCAAKDTTTTTTAPVNSILVPRIGQKNKPTVASWTEKTRTCAASQNHKPKPPSKAAFSEKGELQGTSFDDHSIALFQELEAQAVEDNLNKSFAEGEESVSCSNATTRLSPSDKRELRGNSLDDQSVSLSPEREAQAVEDTPRKVSVEGGGEESVSCYRIASPFPSPGAGRHDETRTLRGKTRTSLDRSLLQIKRKAQRKRKMARELKCIKMTIPMVTRHGAEPQTGDSRSSRKPRRTRPLPGRINTLRNSSITRIRYSY